VTRGIGIVRSGSTRGALTTAGVGTMLPKEPIRLMVFQRTRTPLTALATERMSTVYISWR
jgi:hypothetical protein